jgi:DNA-binding NtrC family response regulator
MPRQRLSGGFGIGLEIAHMDHFDSPSLPLKARLEAYERRLIENALAETAGNQRRAAAALGILPTTLHEKMKRLGLLRRSAARADEEPRILATA